MAPSHFGKPSTTIKDAITHGLLNTIFYQAAGSGYADFRY